MQISSTTALAAALLTLAPAALAQVEFPGSAFGEVLPAIESPVLVARPGNIAALMAEDEERGHMPLRFGTPIPVQIGLQTDGQWDTAPDGTLVWRVEIVAPESKSIGLEFSSYDMPEGAILFAHSGDFTTTFGAFNDRNENPDGEFTIQPIPGESAILELQLPADALGLPSIVVDHVIYDYRGVFELESTLNAEEGGCTVNVNCPEGDPYPELKRAAVRTVSGGSLCSGVLINNTSNDGTRYLYTANHCGTGNNVVIRFNFQTPTCANGGAPTGQNISGATLLANNTVSDGRLLRINNNIPTSYDPYFMGWSRSTAPLQRGVSMHHPGGNPKALGIDNNGGGQLTVGFQGIGNVQVWNMTFQVGGTAGGSSGSGLIDQNNRLRGVLTGGPVGNCQVSYYGRLHNFWNNTNISQFLDPTGSGVTFIDGFDPNGGGPGGPPGGGNQPPAITAVAPASQTAVNPEGPDPIVLTGTNFTGTTDIRINGVSLPTLPPTWSVNSSTQITIQPPQSTTLGPQTIEVVTPLGTDTGSYSIIANVFEPVLDLELSDPAFLITALGIQARIGSIPGNLAILAVGTSPVPSVLPGLVSLDIGNNFTEVFNFGQMPVDSTSGYAEFSTPLNNNLPIGFNLFVQGLVFNPILPVLPLLTTNVQTGTVLF